MNDIKITLKAIDEIIRESARDLTLAERCALRAGLDTFIAEIKDEYVARFDDVDSYMSEKLFKLKWSVDANLGFDITNGHDKQQHCAFAFGALGTIENLARQKFPDFWKS